MHGDATGCEAFNFLNILIYRLPYSELRLKRYSNYKIWTIRKLLEKTKMLTTRPTFRDLLITKLFPKMLKL